jgi:hypothetical protein
LLSSFSGDKTAAVDLLTCLWSVSLSSTVRRGTHSKLGFSPIVPWSRLQSESYWLFRTTSANSDPHRNVALCCRYETSQCLFFYFYVQTIYPFFISPQVWSTRNISLLAEMF